MSAVTTDRLNLDGRRCLLPPEEFPAGLVIGVRIHPGGGKKLVVLGVRVAEQHHHAAHASEVVPLATRCGDVAVGVPNPVTLNNLGGGLDADFRAFDRTDAPIPGRTTNHFDLELVKAEFGQVAIAILVVAIGAIDPARGQRPEIALIRWAMEDFVGLGHVSIEGTIGRGSVNVVRAVLAASRSPIADLRIVGAAVLSVHKKRLADLTLVAHATEGQGFLPGPRKGWQQQRGQDRDNGNDHEQLD